VYVHMLYRNSCCRRVSESLLILERALNGSEWSALRYNPRDIAKTQSHNSPWRRRGRGGIAPTHS
jgi:hypothetical protein